MSDFKQGTSVTTSRFGFITDPSRFQPSYPEDTILLETEHFAVVPSLGSLVPGWVLIVPKRHALNMGLLSNCEKLELIELANQLAAEVGGSADRVFAFEHGACVSGSIVGCGVDQAHLHVVPLSFNLLDTACKKLNFREDLSFGLPSILVPSSAEYVSVFDFRLNKGFKKASPYPTSQYVRRLIADELGRSDEWNYRYYAHFDNIMRTVSCFGNHRGK